MKIIRSKRLAMLSGLLLLVAQLNISCLNAQQGDAGYKKIFDGKTLEGWYGDTSRWHVSDGSIVGQTTAENPLKSNTFLIWNGGKPGDFEFTAEFKISASGNSGINYRSEMFENIPFALKGYQADIDGQNVYTGQNYEERGRAFLAKRGENAVLEKDKPPVIAQQADGDSLKALIKQEGWNKIHIVGQGNRLTHYINGVKMSDVTDNDAGKRRFNGLLGLQAHAGAPMKVEYRNIYIKQ